MSEGEKNLTVIAGPNGSGKTTVIAELVDKGQLTDEIISPDDVVKRPEYSHIEDLKERYIKAMKDAEYTRHSMVEEGVSFAFETVFSNSDKVDFIKLAKEEGFYIELIFVGTLEHAINIERVEIRVSQGGHDVPVEKIVSRWSKSLDNLEKVLPYIDRLTILDNSGNTPELVVFKEDQTLIITGSFRLTHWNRFIEILEQ